MQNKHAFSQYQVSVNLIGRVRHPDNTDNIILKMCKLNIGCSRVVKKLKDGMSRSL